MGLEGGQDGLVMAGIQLGIIENKKLFLLKVFQPPPFGKRQGCVGRAAAGDR